MKKVPISVIHQNDNIFYMMTYDPREIIRLVNVPENNTLQESQRPWNKTKVDDIALYVAGQKNLADDSSNKDIKGKGIMPTCPVLCVTSKLKIISEFEKTYILMPENNDEFEECYDSIKILDGQHRLISFLPENIKINPNNYKYEMGFILFESLDINDMREIFMVTNDKQDKVDPNLLRQIKKWLHLLSEEDDKIYSIIERLNEDKNSPLYKRVIISGEKITNGLKLTQISKILSNSKTYELLAPAAPDKQYSIICNYLSVWYKVYSDIHVSSKKHVLTKISGLRYIMFLFPYIFEIAKECKRYLNEDGYVEYLIKTHFDVTGGYKIFEDEQTKLAFRGESATIALAKRNGNILKEIILNESKVFSPWDND